MRQIQDMSNKCAQHPVLTFSRHFPIFQNKAHPQACVETSLALPWLVGTKRKWPTGCKMPCALSMFYLEKRVDETCVCGKFAIFVTSSIDSVENQNLCLILSNGCRGVFTQQFLYVCQSWNHVFELHCVSHNCTWPVFKHSKKSKTLDDVYVNFLQVKKWEKKTTKVGYEYGLCPTTRDIQVYA